MSAKEKLLKEAPRWSDAQAIAALGVVEAHDELAQHLNDEEGLWAEQLDTREDSWAKENARAAIREERW